MSEDGSFSFITQEIFISMVKFIEKYDEGECFFRTWLYMISISKIIDYCRSRYHKQSVKPKSIEDMELKSSDNIEEEFIKGEMVNEVLTLLNSFEANLQQIFRMKIF